MLSRVADSLYWMARYLERAEHTARLLDVNLNLMLDESSHSAEHRWLRLLHALGRPRHVKWEGNPFHLTQALACDTENKSSVLSCIIKARENARHVREQTSTEQWHRLNSLYLEVTRPELRDTMLNDPSGDGPATFLQQVMESVHQFQGVTDSTMSHGEGWHFIQVGRYLERADSSSRILDLKYHILLPHGEQVGGAIDTVQWQAVLKSCSAFEAYRKLHPGQVLPWSVAEFIILHDTFPRSIHFCAEAVDAALHRISGSDRSHYSNEAERLAGRLCSDLHYTTIGEIFRVGLHEYLDGIQGRLNAVSGAMHELYCEWQEKPAEPAQSQTQSQGVA